MTTSVGLTTRLFSAERRCDVGSSEIGLYELVPEHYPVFLIGGLPRFGFTRRLTDVEPKWPVAGTYLGTEEETAMIQPILERGAGMMVLSAMASMAFAEDGLRFEGRLSGAQEVVFDETDMLVPGGVDTPATGEARAVFDERLTKVSVVLQVRDLTGGFAAAHFHCGRAGQNGPVVFGFVNPGPLTFEGNRVRGELTNTDYTGADCVPIVGRPVNNIASLALAMRDGLIYANVHTDFAPGGEIRGQMLEVGDDNNGNGRGSNRGNGNDGNNGEGGGEGEGGNGPGDD